MVAIGDKFIIKNENGQYTGYTNRAWVVSHIARNRSEHPGYDEGVGQALIDAKGLPFSLYEYEITIISRRNQRR